MIINPTFSSWSLYITMGDLSNAGHTVHLIGICLVFIATMSLTVFIVTDIRLQEVITNRKDIGLLMAFNNVMYRNSWFDIISNIRTIRAAGQHLQNEGRIQ